MELLKQGFKLVDNLEQEFWLGKDLMQFTASLQNLKTSYSMKYVINATRGVLPNFYIFRGERLRDDYISLCRPNTYMEMQKETWMTIFLFKEFCLSLTSQF
jgi:hypothetical protein